MAERNLLQNDNKDNRKIYGVYIQSILNMKVILSITEVGKNIKQNLEKTISKKTEGRCIAEGFIRPNSVKVITYSSGLVNNENIEFMTTFECMVCYPTEGMIVECTVKTITKAGIHAEVVAEEGIVPLTVFIIRDHNYTNKLFPQIKENMKINARIVGTRFEINDTNICAIATLVDMGKERAREQTARKPKLTVTNNEVDIDDVVMDI